MKRLVVVIFATLFAVSAFAQEKAGKKGKHKHTPEQRAEKVANKLKEKLSLTDSQTVAVKTITLEAAQKKMEIKADSTLDKTARKEKMKAIRTDADAKIKAVLTADQQTKYDEMKKKKEAKRKEKKNKKKKHDKVDTDDNGKAGHKKREN